MIKCYKRDSHTGLWEKRGGGEFIFEWKEKKILIFCTCNRIKRPEY